MYMMHVCLPLVAADSGGSSPTRLINHFSVVFYCCMSTAAGLNGGTTDYTVEAVAPEREREEEEIRGRGGGGVGLYIYGFFWQIMK